MVFSRRSLLKLFSVRSKIIDCRFHDHFSCNEFGLWYSIGSAIDMRSTAITWWYYNRSAWAGTELSSLCPRLSLLRYTRDMRMCNIKLQKRIRVRSSLSTFDQIIIINNMYFEHTAFVVVEDLPFFPFLDDLGTVFWEPKISSR